MNAKRVSQIASAIGGSARAAMLVELLEGRALTASELATAAAVTAQTASKHLSQLIENRLLIVTKMGRHRYHYFASPEAAELIERIVQFGDRAENLAKPLVNEPKIPPYGS